MMLLNTAVRKCSLFARWSLVLLALPVALALDAAEPASPQLATEPLVPAANLPAPVKADAPLPGDTPDAALPVKVRKAPKASAGKKGKGKSAAGKRKGKSKSSAKAAGKKSAKPLKKRRK